LGVPDATARLWSTSSKNPSPPRGRFVHAQREVYRGKVQPADLTVSVPRVDGEAPVHLRVLAFEALFRQALGV
jgi:hypothetical protein